MELAEIYYKAYLQKDAKFDGQFFIGVVSTGIYCRPVCTAKMPYRKNCQFFQTAAIAQQAGFRPCLRCRPDLKPGFAPVDISLQLAISAKNFIEKGILNEISVEGLAKRLGITSRHLRRIFIAKFGMSLLKFAQNHCLLLAKQLLVDTSLSITQVAMQAGFNDLCQFNKLFKQYYECTPTEFRLHNMALIHNFYVNSVYESSS